MPEMMVKMQWVLEWDQNSFQTCRIQIRHKNRKLYNKENFRPLGGAGLRPTGCFTITVKSNFSSFMTFFDVLTFPMSVLCITGWDIYVFSHESSETIKNIWFQSVCSVGWLEMGQAKNGQKFSFFWSRPKIVGQPDIFNCFT